MNSKSFMIAVVALVTGMVIYLVLGTTVESASSGGKRSAGSPANPSTNALTDVKRASGNRDVGAVALSPVRPDEPVFSVESAQAAGRPWVLPLGGDYRNDFMAYATKWPDGVVVRGSLDGIGLQSKALNPDGLVVPVDRLADLVALDEKYVAEMTSQGEVAYQLATDAMAVYYDSMHGPGWMPASDAKPPVGEIKGRWSRIMTVRHGDFYRPIRFDSADFEFLEDQLKLIDALKVERLEAVRGFIAREGELPD